MNPLAGKRIVITRASHQADELERLLRERGAIPLLYPCISVQPPLDTAYLNHVLQKALDGAFDWLVLTSTNTVRAIKQSFDVMGIKFPYRLNLRVAAVGSATAQYAEQQLGIKVNAIPEQYSAFALAQTIHLAIGTQVLLPQSEIAEPLLATALSEMGVIVTSVIAYQTVIGSGGIDLPALLARSEVDAITFTSGSTVINLLQRLQNEGGDACLLAQICIACIGTSAATTAKKIIYPSASCQTNIHLLASLPHWSTIMWNRV
jgi:uroporphyrinogen-III synthase